ncbi:MAG: (Fe-S)-binding protein [Candidatus Zixiibacteriota bacterium]|nr:MAG: (Fe-S)-binding protein [candidate division Zixibacteria bacterium]HDL03794.1 (Fe-S)-binding protein [candidate division Zixibacteria bacterium]
MEDRPESQVVDSGLDETIKKLTPDQIERVVRHVMDNETSARLKVYVDTCVHCGLCSEACQTYISRDRDPWFSPVAKVKNSIWELIRRKGKVDGAFIRRMSRIVFTECAVCRRCSMYCPFGIDIAYLLLVGRRICSLLGVVPKYLQDTTNSHAATSNQMWVHQDEWIDTLQWQEEEAQFEIPSARIPLEKEGAEIMYSVIAPEPKILAQLLGNMSQIFTAAGADWTMPATDGWDNSNMAMYSGDFEVMGRVERLHWDTAARLKVKRIVMGECGHAFRGAVYDGPRWLGWQYPPIPMVHAIEYYYELLSTGKIKVKEKYKPHVTVQDPCNTVRGRGLGDKLRYVIDALCENFTDVSPNHEHNYCCMAGGGTINCGPPWKKSRMLSNRVKAEQLEATGAEIVITPCHNCHSGIEDVIGFYKLGMHVKFISEIMVEVMDVPENLKA